jgi:hypothetical protein
MRSSHDQQNPHSTSSFPESLFISERDFNLYEQFTKGGRKRGLGALYKVKLLDEERQINY